MRYAIWDIDNCLTSDEHRVHLIDWELKGNARYKRYNDQMHLDPLHHLAEWTLLRKLGIMPVFFTGRPQEYYDKTMEQLLRLPHLEALPWIFMRGNDESGTPAELKERMLKKFLLGTSAYQVVGAFDDVPAVVAMYRRYGIPATVLAVNDPAKVYAPQDLL